MADATDPFANQFGSTSFAPANLCAQSRDQDSRSSPPSPEDLDDTLPTLKPATRTRRPNAEAGRGYRHLRGKELVKSPPLTVVQVATSRSARTKETAKGRARISPCQRRRQELSADFPPASEAHSQRTGREVKTRRPFTTTNGKGVLVAPHRCWIGRDIVWEESDHGGEELQDNGGAKVKVEKGSPFDPTIGTPAELQDAPWIPTAMIAREVGTTGRSGCFLRFVRP